MKRLSFSDIASISFPKPDSHKGQNGKVLIIGGSTLFHAASLWALEVASRMVDLVHYSSVPENNDILRQIKSQFRSGIVVSRSDVEAYVREDDVIVIGPGMTRDSETKTLTDHLLRSYPDKQWVIDAGSLQMMDPSLIPARAILTPHHQEYRTVFGDVSVATAAKKYACIILSKGVVDVVSNGTDTYEVAGGNEGMTKGGTGDVLAGLVASLTCFTDPFTAALAGSYINKAAGDALYRRVGPFYNASDLVAEIPKTLEKLYY